MLTRLLTQLVGIIISFAITPALVAGLGAELYGAWQVIQRIMSHLAVGHFKPMSVLKLTLAHRQSDPDVAAKRRQVGASLMVWLAALPLVLGLGALALWFLERLIPVAPELRDGVFIAMSIAVFIVALTPLAGAPMGVLKGQNLEYRAMGAQPTVKLLAYGVIYALVVMGFGLPWVVAAYGGQIFVVGALCYWIARRHVSWLGVARPSREEFRGFFRLNLWSLLSAFIQQVFRGGDLILISMTLGPALVTVYTLTRAAMHRTIEPIIALFNAGLPGMGELVGAGDLQRAAQVRLEMVRALLFSAGVVGCVVLLLNEAFLAVWVGAKFYGGDLLTLLLVLTVTIGALTRVEEILIDSALQLKHKSLFQAGAGAAFIGGFLLLQPHLGLMAAPLCLLCAHGAVLLLYMWLNARTLGEPFGAFVRPQIAPLAMALTLLLLCRWALPEPAIAGWGGLFAYGVLLTPAFAVAAWFLVLRAEDRKRLKKRLGRLRK
ncbi:putative oligosaccharide translocase [Magnetofaba australis IT-1]|uniref:Putative oligosaccharide translocase n=2 Tax=Magnetofaba TaxID=1472292 RepID=A0A1Y2K913_9PROT|nr:putative oligosaccharide translocase [Magnetofaba australis IT-1]